MIDHIPKNQDEKVAGELAALERAAASALELGRRLGTPVLVMRDGVMMDIAVDPPRVWRPGERELSE